MFTCIKKSIYKNYIKSGPQNNIDTSWWNYLDDNWKSLQRASLKKGTKVLYNDKLYIILQDISIVLQKLYIDIAALYAEMNQETLSYPIPYNNNTKLFRRKCYVQNDIVYYILGIQDNQRAGFS